MKLVLLALLTAGCAASSTGTAPLADAPESPAPVVVASKPPPAKPKPPAPAAKTFANCTEMRKVYPGGVAKPGAVNRGEPLTTRPKTDAALYAANEGKDRDEDGLACES